MVPLRKHSASITFRAYVRQNHSATLGANPPPKKFFNNGSMVVAIRYRRLCRSLPTVDPHKSRVPAGWSWSFFVIMGTHVISYAFSFGGTRTRSDQMECVIALAAVSMDLLERGYNSLQRRNGLILHKGSSRATLPACYHLKLAPSQGPLQPRSR